MESIWKIQPTVESINAIGKNTLVDHIGIQFIEVGNDFLIAKMPVDHRTRQPMGLLHGGASVSLAETMGSVASFLCLENQTEQSVVGLEINANHLRSATSGFVYGKVTPIRIGRTVHVWEIKIEDEKSKLCCISRLTISVINHR